MKVSASILFVIVLALLSFCCKAQQTVEVSKPRLSIEGKKVLITYDLVYSNVSDRFSVRIEVTDANKRPISARSLSGDVGEGISGGSNKRILWDLETDNIFLNEDISVQVFAKQEMPVVAEKPVVAQEPDMQEKESQKQLSEKGKKTYSRMSISAQSLVLPGLGLSRVHPGKPHWIKGVVAYGCLGGAIYLNSQAWNNYNNYQDPTSPEQADELFNTAVKQDKISEVLGFSALGIWIVDLVWTIVGTSDLNSPQSSGTQKGFSIGTIVEPVSSAPLIALRYTF